jgi:hypothetical protein
MVPPILHTQYSVGFKQHRDARSVEQMQGKCYGSKSAVGDSRLATSGTQPLSHSPGFGDAAAVQTWTAQKRGLLWGPLCDAPRSAPQNAARLGDPSVRQAVPCAPLLMTDPSDLIARALIILAEEDEAWRARRGLDLTPRSVP